MRNYVRFLQRNMTVKATQHPSMATYTFPVQLACDDFEDAEKRTMYFMAGFTQDPVAGTTYEITASTDSDLWMKMSKKKLCDVMMAFTICGINGDYTPITYLRATPGGTLNGRPNLWAKNFVDKSPRKFEEVPEKICFPRGILS